MNLKLLCVTAEIVLSPKVEDRYTRFRFVPVGEVKQDKGSCWTDAAIWVTGEPGAYQIGKQYDFSLSIKEA